MANIQLLQGTEKIKDSYTKINTSLTNLNNDKLEKSGDTMTGPLSLLYGLKLLSNALPTDEFGWLYADGAQHDIFFRDATTFRRMWHGGNNPASVAANGYQKFASGLIVQWGFATVAGNNVGTPITYPITFLNVVANVLTVPRANIGVAASPENPTTSGFTCYQGHSTDLTVHWIAIGW